MVRVEWQGLAEMVQAFDRLRAQALPAMGVALGREGDAILQQSQALVPVDTGALRDSAMRIGPETTRTAVVVELRYGRFGLVPYALEQHENVLYQHPHGGQAHYLSQPLFTATSGMVDRLGNDFWPALRPRG